MGREGTTKHVEKPPMFWCFTKMGNLPRKTKLKKPQELWTKTPQFLFKAFLLWLMVAWCLGLSCILKRIPTDFPQLKISCLQTFSHFPTGTRHFEANPWTKKNIHNIQKMILPGEFAQLFLLLDEITGFLEWSFCSSYSYCRPKNPVQKTFRLQVTQRQNPYVTCQRPRFYRHVLGVPVEAKS